jgi:hypothetical protein
MGRFWVVQLLRRNVERTLMRDGALFAKKEIYYGTLTIS